MLSNRCVVDTTNALYLWEWPGYPAYYIPVEDIADGLLRDTGQVEQQPRGLALRPVMGLVAFLNEEVDRIVSSRFRATTAFGCSSTTAKQPSAPSQSASSKSEPRVPMPSSPRVMGGA